MIGPGTEIYAQRSPFRRMVDLWIQRIEITGPSSGRRLIPKSIEWIEIDEMADPPPLLSIKDEAAQGLMDELYRNGYRPSDAPNTASSLAATNHHLSDMRRIVAKTTGVELP